MMNKQENVNRKYRLALTKGEEVRFLSHLDYAQALERMIRRANLPAAYSEGFNPHMKISFSYALALGVTAIQEYMDLELEVALAPEEIQERLNATAAPGIRVVEVREIPVQVKKLMAICNYAEYTILGTAEEGADWNVLLKPFNEAEELPYKKVTPKKVRDLNMKDFIRGAITVEQKGTSVRMHVPVGIYPTGTVKPSEIWRYGKEQFGWPVSDGYSLSRDVIAIEQEGKILTPFEIL